MRALVLNSFDGIDGLELSEVPDPEPGEGEVPVTIRAAALGVWDLSGAQGAFKDIGGATEFPQIQGWDFAGETDRGERVFGFVAPPFMGIGSFAEKLSVPPAVLAGLPESISFEDGAAFPVTALTARLMVNSAHISQDDLVLVTGAAGMVGGSALQQAVAAKARVVAAVRAEDADAARKLGAEAVVQTGPDLEAEVREQFTDGVDACLDTIGLGDAGLVCVRDGGAFVTSVPNAVPKAARGIYPGTIGVQPDGPSLAQLATRVTDGELTIRVAETLPLEQFKRGYELLAGGGVRGKIVFTM
jgi:NADPH:quinone reductase-like Zn-dependent oxidoreductase